EAPRGRAPPIPRAGHQRGGIGHRRRRGAPRRLGRHLPRGGAPRRSALHARAHAVRADRRAAVLRRDLRRLTHGARAPPAQARRELKGKTRMASPRIEGKVLITGASGFIGRRLRDALLDDGTDVVSIRRPGSPEAKRGRSVVLSYSDVDAIRKTLERERPDYLFHLAGATKGVTYEDFRQANVLPTKNLALAVRDVHPALKRFVHVSSLSSYGPSAKDRHHRGDEPRKPIEFYGQSKLEAER